MMHPNKWRETQDPYLLKYKNFRLLNIIGYPYAGNDVFYANGIYNNTLTDVYIKIARQNGADIENEVNIINKLKWNQMP